MMMDYKLRFVVAKVQAPSMVHGSHWDLVALRVISCPMDFRLLPGDRINVVFVM